MVMAASPRSERDCTTVTVIQSLNSNRNEEVFKIEQSTLDERFQQEGISANGFDQGALVASNR